MTNELNPFILKNIYSDSDLYLLTIDKQEEPIPFLGKNQKKCVILVNEKNHTFLEKTDLTFLENILKAINYSIDDIVLINYKHSPVSFERICQDFSPKQIIFFDVLPFLIGIQEQAIMLYEVTEYKNISLLSADSLQKIQENVDKKKALWLNLKRIFQLNN